MLVILSTVTDRNMGEIFYRGNLRTARAEI
jgi:hypothetical protein